MGQGESFANMWCTFLLWVGHDLGLALLGFGESHYEIDTFSDWLIIKGIIFDLSCVYYVIFIQDVAGIISLY